MEDRYLDALEELVKRTSQDPKQQGRGIRRPSGEILALIREIRRLRRR